MLNKLLKKIFKPIYVKYLTYKNYKSLSKCPGILGAYWFAADLAEQGITI